MNTSINVLTETTVENGRSILASTLITKGVGEHAHRIVLRFVKDEYVVHLETLHVCTIRFADNSGEQDCYTHAGYVDGYYTKDQNLAWENFSHRARTLLTRLTGKEVTS